MFFCDSDSNIDGFTSKKESLDDITDTILPDVVTLNETLLTGKRAIKKKKYMSFCKNRDDSKEGGGVATLVADYLRPDTVKVGEGTEGDEYVIVRLGHVIPAVNIVNIYGDIESRAGGKDKILEKWIRLRKAVKEIKERGEGIVLIGDMNRHIGCGQYGVTGNSYEVSYGGQLVRELLQTEEFVLLNNLSLAEGRELLPLTCPQVRGP